MGKKTLVGITVIQFGVICALTFLLLQEKRPSQEKQRVETALAGIRGALSVGANYTQFQEKIQVLAVAVEGFRSTGRSADDLVRFERALKLYKDSLDLWSDQLHYPVMYESERHRFTPIVLERIAREQSFDLSLEGVSYKVLADVLLQDLWKKADDAARGVNPSKMVESPQSKR